VAAVTVVEFLTARLDEEQAIAERAAATEPGIWAVCVSDGGQDLEVLGQFKRDHPVPQPPQPLKGDWYAVAGWSWDDLDPCGLDTTDLVPTAEHIARHDPARVLADIAAKRAILALHAHYVEQKREGGKYLDTWRPDEGCETCHWDNDCGCIENSGYPCDTVGLLASVYADHPEFDPAWRLT